MFIFSWKLYYTQQREVQIYFTGNMADAGMFAEEECRPEQPLNNEEDNLKEGSSG